LGSRWIIIELFGSMVDIVGGIIGAGIIGFGFNFVLDKTCDHFIKSDSKKMWEIINIEISDLTISEQDWIKEYISNSCLKSMFARSDRYEFAKDLIKTLHAVYLEALDESTVV
jgi:hypothetical protein